VVRRRQVFAGAVLAACAAMSIARRAGAFTIDSIVTDGCHERMTADAFRRVRADLDTAAPLPATRNERALIDDVQFTLASDMSDLGGATLLIGVRDNDLKGRDSNDLSQLALVHGDPMSQHLHCLRRSHDPEPGGTEDALLECRTFILDTVAQALDGLDAGGRPDPTIRTSLSLWLSLRHHVDAPLPTYYLRIGQAIHTAQDVFAHTFRTPDQASVTVVVNWIDEVEGRLQKETDGPPHATELDRCDNPDELRTTRRMLATQAAEDLLRTTLDPTLSRDEKMAAVTALVDGWLGYSPGCTFENDWCAAPERAYGNRSLLSCEVGEGGRADGWAVAGVALAVFAALRRQRRGPMGFAAVLVLLAPLAGRALAQETAPPEVAHLPPPRTTPIAEPGPADRSQPAWGGFLGVAGSGTNAAVAATLGLRLRATTHWTFGLDAEWNPWLAVNGTTEARAGSFNGFGTAIFRVPLVYQRFNLRMTYSFGASHTLIDLFGVPKGTTGIYAAISPLGVEWKASRLFYLILNPLGFAAPVPQLRGIPFWYPQYRVSIGVEMYAR
jgi:MYXO-CTERM domain-containing protein